MLTFIEERRQRLRKAREEGFSEGRREGRAEGREEGCREIIRILSRNPQIDALFREDPKIRERLRELGIEPPDQRNGDD